MENKLPKITVITPTYNRADFIKETIESVLKQDYKDFEYLILDDGSTDNTAKIVKPYLKDKRVKYFYHENQSEAETVNWGWSMAKGEYFTQVNSDDPILPKLFSEMVKVLDNKEDIVVVYPNFYFIDSNRNIIKEIKTTDWNFLDLLGYYSCECATPGTFIRKKPFQNWKKIKDSKYHYINDTVMYWNMALSGNFFHLNKYLANWRVHSGGISVDRYKSIDEVLIWFEYYFSQKLIPKDVLDCKYVTRKSIYLYLAELLRESNLSNKEILLKKYKNKLFPLMVSIIIPVFNGSKYLKKAVDSALSQTYENFEVIIVNDGSTDDSEKIIKEYGNKLRYFKKKNGGVASALNYGIKKARGQYISWLSHDDEYYPEKIDTQVVFINKYQCDIDVLYSNVEFVNEKSKTIGFTNHEQYHSIENLNNGLYPVLKGLVNGCSMLIKKSCFKEIGFFNEKLRTSNDYDMWFRMFSKCKVIFLPKVLIKYRLHKDQGTKVSNLFLKESNKLWIKMIENIPINEMKTIEKSEFNFYFKMAEQMKASGYNEAYVFAKKLAENSLKNKPKVSIVMPCYNSEKYLKEAIDSILSQTFCDFELIIIDDGSVDSTWKIINDYKSIDFRIMAIKSDKNQGISKTMNIGLNIARGDYITRMDSDDISIENRLEEQVCFLEKNEKYGMCSVYMSSIDKEGKDLPEKLYYNVNIPLEWLFIWLNPISNAPTMFRSEILKKHKIYFDDKFVTAEDYNFLSKIVLYTKPYQIPKILYKYRIHDKNISNNNLELSCANSIKVSNAFSSAITSKVPPKFHSCFTDFSIFFKKNKDVFLSFNKEDCLRWMKNMLISCKKKWNWNYDEFCNAIYDAENRINRIFSKSFPISYNVRSLGSNLEKNIFNINFIKNVQIGDNDLIGNKFNGHNLHLYLREKFINSSHLVWNKESDDENTYFIAGEKKDRELIKQNVLDIQNKYSFNSILNPIAYDILYNELFLKTDIAHFHLVHNNIFDLQLLPIMTRLKPIVWTLHDPWALGGHCIHHYDCEKWKTQCGDCTYLDSHFGLDKDNSALNFEIKKQAIQNSSFDVIVASKWMKEKVEKSPIFKGKKIHLIPFGIDQEIFKPINKAEAKKELNIPKEVFVVTFRCDYSEFKGMDYIEYVLEKLKTKRKIYLLLLAGDFNNKDKIKFEYKSFGWVKDDNLLAKIYNITDLFLAPSKADSFGMMVAEVMSCGVLPIVLDGTALPDTVNAPECGVSVKRDKDEYLKTVQYYIDHDKERNDRAKKCLEFAKKTYDKDIYVDKIIKVYKEAIKRHIMTDEDNYLLDQLKKYMMVEPQSCLENSQTNSVSSSNNFINVFNKILHGKYKRKIKDGLLICFYKIDKIIPKSIRSKVKPLVSKFSLVKKYLIKTN